MKILYLGEIVSKPGRKAIKEYLPKLIKKHKPDFVFANGENLTHNRGMNERHLQEILDIGVDYFTTGNHIWDNKTFFPKLEKEDTPVLRPANYSDNLPGKSYIRITKDSNTVFLFNLSGRTFMDEKIKSPFLVADEILKNKQTNDVVVLDFHAETTSEKLALSYYLQKKVQLFIGSHTHVPTADEEVRGTGMAYITDIGMIGPKESVLGIKKEIIIKKFLTNSSIVHDIAGGDAIFNAILVNVDIKTKKSTSIQRIQEIIPA
ncbi:YmdB family metallophosphoesterase [Patescibacteria group bacterium]